MHRLSAIELRNQFLEGKVSAVQITEHFLNRIERLDGKLGAFLVVLKERALAKAKALDEKKARKEPLGKLAGIPIGIKDNIHIEGVTTTCASKFLSNYKAPFSSTAVTLLENEDAIILGKLNMDEFGMGSSTENSAYKLTYNPWNLKCTPGGSSGGSAAAVSSRMVLAALGTDTGGSIRQPASLCGIVGFKPTYGRISRYGIVAFGSSLDQIGPVTTTAADSALFMEVMGRNCPKDATSNPEEAEDYLNTLPESLKGKKIGVPWQFLGDLAEEPKKIFMAAIEKLKELGAEVVDVDLSILKYSLAVYYILATAEASTNLARFDGIRYGVRASRANTLDEVYDFSKEDGFGPEVKRRILLGTYVLSAGYQDAYYRKAQKVRTLIIESFQKAFTNCDIVAFPVSPFAAFELGSIKDPLQMYLEDIYTISANLAGIPAVSVPAGFSVDGKPMGLQLLGPQKQDVRVLQFAHAFEKALKLDTLPPLAQVGDR